MGVTPVRTASRDGRGEGMVSIFVRNSVGCPRTGSIFAASRSARSSACLAMLASLRFLEIAAAYGLKVLRFGLKAPDRQGPVVAIARTLVNDARLQAKDIGIRKDIVELIALFALLGYFISPVLP